MSAADIPLGDRPAASLTQADFDLALRLMLEDPRTESAEHVGGNRFRVRIGDVAQGRLDGIFSLGRIFNEMKWTTDDYQAHLRVLRSQREEEQKAALERALEREQQKVVALQNRERNLALMEERGIKISTLKRVVERITGGRYIGDEDVKIWHEFAAIAGMGNNINYWDFLNRPWPAAEQH